MGAWIETAHVAMQFVNPKSLPVWERGLKRDINDSDEMVTRRSPYGSVD